MPPKSSKHSKEISPEDKNVIQQSVMSDSGEKSGPSHFVGIGASAGGLEALQNFFDHMPADSGLAFIIVQHLSPDYKSLMVELLSKHTAMKVHRVEDGQRIEPDCIYLIPPKKNMVVHGGNLYLSEQPQRHALNLPIDVFLRSMAEDQGEKSIAIILSGTGSDGTRGVRAIKEEGGTVLVHTPDSAKFDGMPKSAIATGLADFVLPPEEMPEQLLQFINHPYVAKQQPPAEDYGEGEDDRFSRLFSLIKKRFSVDFTYYKPTTVVRRVERRMGIKQAQDLDEYLSILRTDSGELAALYKDLLIGVTKFFRDTDQFTVLREKIIPKLFEQAAKEDTNTIRMWVAGCSTGEEAYSVAMLLKDYQDRHSLRTEIKVFATDIDKTAIEAAGQGVYPESIVADVEMDFLSKYFEKRATGYQVKRSVREMVVFALQNITKDPPFTKVDLISCRNMLIYLQPVLQKKVLSIFNYALKPSGFLFLGTSETIGDLTDVFKPLDPKSRIYKHLGKGTLPLRDELMQPLTRDMGISSAYKVLHYGAEDPLPKRFENQDAYYQAIVRRLTPSAIVINQNRELVQSFGDTSAFLRVPEGKMTLDVLSMMPRELALAASSGIHRARKEQKSAVYRDIRVKKDGVVELYNLSVDMLSNSRGDGRPDYFLLSMKQEDRKLQVTDAEAEPDDFIGQRISDLEQELQFTRENLQAIIEELQTSNEELQATNEELLAANEELQSTNEELQSVNEELNTVNTEYQAKNLELTALNNDMRNLMEATEIGTIFLDEKLRIRKFTPAITKVIKLMEQDVGRPLSDFSTPGFSNITKDIRAVLADGDTRERTIDIGKSTFLLRVLPFHDDEGVNSGAVLTMVDITARRQAEITEARQNELLERTLMASPSAQIMVDAEGTIGFANEMAQSMLGTDKSELLGTNLTDAGLNLADMEGVPLKESGSPLAIIKRTLRPMDNFVVRHAGNGQDGYFNLIGNPLLSPNNTLDGVVFTFSPLGYTSGTQDKGDG